MLGLALILGLGLAACPTPQLGFIRAATCVDAPVFSVEIAEDVCHPATYTSCGACNGSSLCGGKDWAACFAALGCTETTSFRLSNGTAIVYFGPACTGSTVLVTDCLYGFIDVCGDAQVNFRAAIEASQCVPPDVTTTGGTSTASSSASSSVASGSASSSVASGSASSSGGSSAASTIGGAGSSTAGGGASTTSASAPRPSEAPAVSAAPALVPW